MSYIGKNIKKIRTIKKLSQADFAREFNLARPSVGAYEEGRSEPKIDTVIQIAEKYSLSIDALLTKELSINDLFHFDHIHEGLAYDKKSSVFSVSNKNQVALVRADQHLEYVVSHDKRQFIASLEKINLPHTKSDENRAFEVKGSEMEFNHRGLHHGDILVTEKIKKIDVSLEKSILVVITDNAVNIRRFEQFHEGYLLLVSDDPNYEVLKIPTDQITESWKAFGVFSTYLEAPVLLEEKVLGLEKRINKLEKAIKLH